MRGERGFSYVLMMFLVGVVALVSVRALENTSTAERRAKEAQLLLVGQAYRNAIRDYYEGSPGTAKVYPPDLDSLLLDARTTRLRRPLRKLFRDPMTDKPAWGLVRTEHGEVMGVFSLSAAEPFKQDGFSEEQASFANAKHYRDWHFVYEPK